MRAYFEWIPIRPVRMGPEDRIYRSFSVGNLAEIIMLDTRVIGRDEQANATDWKAIYNRTRWVRCPVLRIRTRIVLTRSYCRSCLEFSICKKLENLLISSQKSFERVCSICRLQGLFS